MTSSSFWRAPLLRIQEEVEAGVEGRDLHWAFRGRLGVEGSAAANEWLAGYLWKELRRRRLIDVPGQRLGERFAHYSTTDARDEDLRAELLDACFERVFSAGRLRTYVAACADPDWDPDPMIQRNARNFLHELQRAGDPGGTALFDGLRNAAASPERLSAGTYCPDTRTLILASPTGVADPDRVRDCFERTGALEPLLEKLEQRLSGPTHAQLRGVQIEAALALGLTALQAEACGSITIDELVRELRPLLPAEGRRAELHDNLPAVEASTGFDAGVLLELEDDATCAVERAPGLQLRTRGHLLELLRTICSAVRDGRDPELAARELGWAKQSLFDRRRRLTEVLQSELPLAAGVFPTDEAGPEGVRCF